MKQDFAASCGAQKQETKKPEFVPKTKAKHAKIVVMKHGTSYVEKDTELCACPECGSVDITELKDCSRKMVARGYIVNKTTITHEYKCSGCGCEFNTQDIRRKVHRLRGGLGLVIAIVLFMTLFITIVCSQTLLTSNAKKDASELLAWRPALKLTVKAVIPNILALFLIDYRGIYEDLD